MAPPRASLAGTHTIGVPPVRAAGARSGIGTVTLDAALPFQGVVGDILAKESKGQKEAYRILDHGDGGGTEVLSAVTFPGRMTGGHPARQTTKRLGSIPGYGGHVEGKVAENVHGGTYRSENERTQRTLENRDLRRTASCPNTLTITVPPYQMTPEALATAQRQHGATMGLNGNALNVAPHIPGYMTTMPGKMSETVHGFTTGESSHKAQELRRCNPHVSCEGWLRKGVWPSDRRPTYKFNTRFMESDAQHLFSRAQDEDFTEDNRRLGHTFGLNPPRPTNLKPGDRYLHTLTKPKKIERLNPSEMNAAGKPTHSVELEAERWKMHHTLALKNGNQRNAY
jgi:hypothetical protein